MVWCCRGRGRVQGRFGFGKGKKNRVQLFRTKKHDYLGLG